MYVTRPAIGLAGTTVRRWATVAALAGLTALASRLTIELPGTPVPLTLQTACVLLSGLLLGARAGAGAQALYLATIAAGLPLDARLLGPAAFAGPTAGYLLGFVAAAATAGYLAGQLGRRPAGLAVASLAGLAALYLCGTAWLSLWMGAGLAQAIGAGVLPFLVPDLAKATLAAIAARVLQRRVAGRP